MEYAWANANVLCSSIKYVTAPVESSWYEIKLGILEYLVIVEM